MAENKKRFLLAYREQLQEADKREKKPSLLLHACCAPCSSAVLEELSKHFSLQICYYNPNIQPKGEYDLRLSETARLAFAINPEIKMMDVPYEPEKFLSFAKEMADLEEGGARCEKCFALRLFETARMAKEGGFDYFATTLTLSPMKDAALLNSLGKAAEEAYGVSYLISDFKKEGGYLYSIRQSEKYALYRQDYCGCVYSKLQAEKRRKEKRETKG